MDGDGCLYAVLQGKTKTILHQFQVSLPKKHGRGGQSAVRFARLRVEKRHNYLRKVAETAVECFIHENKVNVNGLVLAGSADLKTELSQSSLFDPRLASSVVKVVDVAYGGQTGFYQAVNQCQELFDSHPYFLETQLIEEFMQEIKVTDGKFCYGVDQTLAALDSGAIEKLIVWESLNIEGFLINGKVSQKLVRLREKNI